MRFRYVFLFLAACTASLGGLPSNAQTSAHCQQVSREWKYQHQGRKMSAAWMRATACMPPYFCQASCEDFDAQAQVLRGNRAVDRKWIFDCNGVVTLGDGKKLTSANFDAYHDGLYAHHLKKRQEVCDAK